MADRADRLAGLEERPHERDRVVVGPQEVRIGHAARENQPVVIGRVGVLHPTVDLELVGLVEVLESLDLALIEGDEVCLGALVLHGLPRLGQLDLLHAVGSQECNRLPIQLAHLAPPSRALLKRLGTASGGA